jgi:hypothetical protein
MKFTLTILAATLIVAFVSSAPSEEATHKPEESHTSDPTLLATGNPEGTSAPGDHKPEATSAPTDKKPESTGPPCDKKHDGTSAPSAETKKPEGTSAPIEQKKVEGTVIPTTKAAGTTKKTG